MHALMQCSRMSFTAVCLEELEYVMSLISTSQVTSGTQWARTLVRVSLLYHEEIY